MFFSSNENKLCSEPIALRKVDNRPVCVKRVLLLIFVLCGLSSGYNAFAKPVNKEVMAWAPLSAANLSMTLPQMSTSVAFPTQTSSVSLHHFDISCSRCHDENQSSNSSELQSPLEEIGLVDVNRSCSSFGCHSYDRDMNHPVGQVSGMTSSSAMPLDANGQMTCLTCHTQPVSETAIPVENAINERMLQTSKDGEICGACHASSIGGGGNQVHWQFSKKAHLGKIKRNSDDSFDEFSLGGSVDDESQTCVGCHDDVTVTVPGLFETPTQKKMRYRKMKDHPIGMEYSAIVTRDAGRYINSHTISDKVRLFDGRVGCGSCHSLYSGKKNLLIVDHTVSQLCRQCHLG